MQRDMPCVSYRSCTLCPASAVSLDAPMAIAAPTSRPRHRGEQRKGERGAMENTGGRGGVVRDARRQKRLPSCRESASQANRLPRKQTDRGRASLQPCGGRLRTSTALLPSTGRQDDIESMSITAIATMRTHQPPRPIFIIRWRLQSNTHPSPPRDRRSTRLNRSRSYHQLAPSWQAQSLEQQKPASHIPSNGPRPDPNFRPLSPQMNLAIPFA